MVEREILIDQKKIGYEGIFDSKELFKLIDQYFRDHRYDKYEKKNFEHVYPSGKQVEIETWPWRKVTDYYKYLMKVHILMTDLKQVEVEKKGIRTSIDHGKVLITFDMYLETDYESRWEQKPMFVFLRFLFDKYFYQVYAFKYQQGAVEEVNQLHALIKSFLNMHRYEFKRLDKKMEITAFGTH